MSQSQDKRSYRKLWGFIILTIEAIAFVLKCLLQIIWSTLSLLVTIIKYLFGSLTEGYRIVRSFLKRWYDNTELQPVSWLLFILMNPVALLLAFFWGSAFVWLPNLNVDSAKWVLSTQSQATAAILGLLIAAVIFRLHSVAERETPLLDRINTYMKHAFLSCSTRISSELIVDMVYKEYHFLIARKAEACKKKEIKAELISLGRFWVIRELTSLRCNKSPIPRGLSRGKLENLRLVNYVAVESAVKMWDDYWTAPSGFILAMFETLTQVSKENRSILAMTFEHDTSEMSFEEKQQISKETIADQYGLLEGLRQDMFDDYWMFEAQRMQRTRRAFHKVFPLACIILFFAVVLGFLGLIGINNPEVSRMQEWLVGLPVSLSIVGGYLGLTTVVTAIAR